MTTNSAIISSSSLRTPRGRFSRARVPVLLAALYVLTASAASAQPSPPPGQPAQPPAGGPDAGLPSPSPQPLATDPDAGVPAPALQPPAADEPAPPAEVPAPVYEPPSAAAPASPPPYEPPPAAAPPATPAPLGPQPGELAITPATPELAVDLERPSKLPAYVLWGAGGASLIVGTVFGISALSAKSDFDDRPSFARADSVHDRAVRSDVAFGLGLVLALTGTVFYLIADAAEEDAPAAAPAGPAAQLKLERAGLARAALQLEF